MSGIHFFLSYGIDKPTNMIIMTKVEQGSECWKCLRRCFVTGTMFSSLMDKNPYVKVSDLVCQIERHDKGMVEDRPMDARAERNMAWGKMHEPDGFAEYGVKYVSPDPEESQKRLTKVGFVVDDSFKIGVSPDGFVDDDGIIEIKCPVSRKFYDPIPEYHKFQVMALLGVTKRKWCDLVQWTPHGIKVDRFTLDEPLWEAMKTSAINFWDYHEKHYRQMKSEFAFMCQNVDNVDVGEVEIGYEPQQTTTTMTTTPPPETNTDTNIIE